MESHLTRFLKVLLMSLVFLCISGITLNGQEKYVLTSEQELYVLGTSTMHNWEMVTSSAKGEGVFTLKDGRLSQVKNFKVQFRGEDLESGRGIMNRNTRRALEVDNHPLIIFKLIEYARNEDGSEIAYGDFTAAGVTRKLMFNVSSQVKEGNLHITGEASFKLTDFNIEPPVALAGTLRTGDAVSLEFMLVFEAEDTNG